MKKRRTISKIGIFSLMICAFFINSAVLMAQSQVPAKIALVNSAIQESDMKAIKRIRFLQSIRDEIRTTQKDYQEVTRDVTIADTRLTEVQQVVTTLKDQLNKLDTQIKDTEDMILNVTMQIGATENELVLLYEEMDIKKAELENQKMMLLEYLQTIYETESGITDTTGGNEDINIAKLLLSDESVGDQLQQIKYFGILEETGHQIFNSLESLMNELKSEEIEMQNKKDKLSLLYLRLGDEKINLNDQKEAKAILLEDTKGEEKVYQQLLEESVRQQEQVKTDLDTLNENLNFLQHKIRELGDDFNPEDYFSLLSPETTLVYDYINQTRADGLPDLQWPISPSRGITAYFQDPSYRKVFGFVHNAVDIRAAQGSLVRAPADGIAYKVKDNGKGYSYLIVAHQGGLMTVYGHLTEFLVEEGDKIYQGQVLGYSGGTPGTKGAGFVTTGAHLHFELMKDGKYVDPLDYLPLDYVPLDNLPEKYQARAMGTKLKVRRIPLEEDLNALAGSLTQEIERNAVIEELTKNALQNQSVTD